MSTTFPALLRQMKAVGATDLFLCRGKSPSFRVNGKIIQNKNDPLTEEELDLFAVGIMSEEQNQQFHDDLEINISYKSTGIGRFRINLFRQQQYVSMVVRSIPSDIATPEDLNLPAAMTTAIMQKRGLILIVGPSGAGKSTTLASLLDCRNQNSSSHIITIEDPIEYIIDHKRSIVNQREIGVDTKSYHNALESALRQSPDVLGIGEIRSRDTMEHAISFADTGHLCIATLHANNSTQAIERIVNMFPDTKREQILLSLSMHVQAILAQQLVPKSDGQLTAAFEVMQSSPRLSDLIEKGDFVAMHEALEKDSAADVLTMDQSLYNMHEKGIISAETALEYANSYQDMRLRMRLSSTVAKSASLMQ